MSSTAGFLGPIASYSHQAALAVFPPSKPTSSSAVQLKPLQTFTDIFSALDSRSIDYGIIPFENSTNGSVIPTLDLLADRNSQWTNLQVVGEYYLPVHHCLLTRRRRRNTQREESYDNGPPPKERIQRISKLYTHPQAWGQCETFLSTHLKGVERQDVSSTSKGAEVVSREGTSSPTDLDDDNNDNSYSAAIASQLAAEIYDLEILVPNIEDSTDNVTRFFIFTRTDIAPPLLSSTRSRIHHARSATNNPPSSPSTPSLKHKSLLSFTVPHSLPGALAKALNVFSANAFNLTSIDTRPSRKPGRAWQYIFFVECEETSSSSSSDSTTRNHDAAAVDVSEDKLEGRRKSNDNNEITRLTAELEKVVEECRVWGRWDDMLSIPVESTGAGSA